MDEAQRNYQIACSMAPGNAEYQQALNMMQQRSGGYRPNGYTTTTQCDPCSAYLCCSCLTPWGGMCC